MVGDPPEVPPGIPPDAEFCGNMRWHRNELRPSNAIINAAFPEELIESELSMWGRGQGADGVGGLLTRASQPGGTLARYTHAPHCNRAGAKTKDMLLTIMSIPVGTERMIQFDGIRLGQTSGKWRISGATALVNSINMNPDSKHVAWYRKTIDGEVHWFVTEPVGDPVEGNLCLPSARGSGEPGDGPRARKKRNSRERGAQGESSDEGGDEDGAGGAAGRGRSTGRGKKQRMGLQSAAEMHSALIAGGAGSSTAGEPAVLPTVLCVVCGSWSWLEWTGLRLNAIRKDGMLHRGLPVDACMYARLCLLTQKRCPAACLSRPHPAAALAAATAAVSGSAMLQGLGIPHEVAAAAAAAAAAGGQAACKVTVTPRMREGGFVVLDHVFGAVAGLTVTGTACAASMMLSMLEPEGSVVNVGAAGAGRGGMGAGVDGAALWHLGGARAGRAVRDL